MVTIKIATLLEDQIRFFFSGLQWAAIILLCQLVYCLELRLIFSVQDAYKITAGHSEII